jgi:hypothetical protein
MAHIIETIENLPTKIALEKLREAHSFISKKVIAAQSLIGTDSANWGIKTKRMFVDLSKGPDLVGKSTEKFVELINILATTERTIEALEWLTKNYPSHVVQECHASTSDYKGGNDIVLTDQNGFVKVRCEVCDVASRNAGQNKKEKNDLKILGCAEVVPNDGTDRFIATSSEFARALTSTKRKWSALHYHYDPIDSGLPQNTVMLRVTPNKNGFVNTRNTSP